MLVKGRGSSKNIEAQIPYKTKKVVNNILVLFQAKLTDTNICGRWC